MAAELVTDGWWVSVNWGIVGALGGSLVTALVTLWTGRQALERLDKSHGQELGRIEKSNVLELGRLEKSHTQELARIEKANGHELAHRDEEWKREDVKERLKEQAHAYRELLSSAYSLRPYVLDRGISDAEREKRATERRNLYTHVDLVGSREVRNAFKDLKGVIEKWWDCIASPSDLEEYCADHDLAYDALAAAARNSLAEMRSKGGEG